MSLERFNSGESDETKTYLSQQVEGYIKSQILSKLKKEAKEEFLEKRGITVDINIQKIRKAGNEEFDVSISTLDGFPNMKIENTDVFVHFCKLHGFIPVLNDIYIEGVNLISRIKELETFLLYGLQNGEFNIGIFGELSKINDSIKEFFSEEYNENISYSSSEISRAVWQFQRLFVEVPNEILKINGSKISKGNTKGTLIENIFAEIALRTEDQIRNQTGIFSTYLVGASLEQDQNEKTDFIWTLKTDKNEEYIDIPVQFTVENTYRADPSNKKKTSNKVEDIENYLACEKSNGGLSSPFVTVFLNGRFKESVGPEGLIEEYNYWINNQGNIRERQDTEGFPFFINSIDPRLISGPEIVYFMLHIIFKTNSFEGGYKNNNIIKKSAEELERRLNEFLEFLPSDRVKLGNGNVYTDRLNFNVQANVINKKDNMKNNITLNKFFVNIYYKGEYLGAILIHK